MKTDNIIHFNNCQGRNHASIFGKEAFFDLGSDGPQSTQVKNLQVGQECVVASYARDGQVIFDWYSLLGEVIMTDNDGIACRVFFGDLLSTEQMGKATAATSSIYSAFFNVNGDFKRPSVIIAAVSEFARPRNQKQKASYCPEEVDPSGGPYTEGATRQITVNVYERSAAARSACLAAMGTSCCICGFNFEAVYGEVAAGYIHVHHKKPLSTIKSEYQLDPVVDLCPVCPNCHAVLHLGGATRTNEDVKSMIVAQSK